MVTRGSARVYFTDTHTTRHRHSAEPHRVEARNASPYFVYLYGFIRKKKIKYEYTDRCKLLWSP